METKCRKCLGEVHTHINIHIYRISIPHTRISFLLYYIIRIAFILYYIYVGIAFQDVCFSYPARPDEPVLKVSGVRCLKTLNNSQVYTACIENCAL